MRGNSGWCGPGTAQPCDVYQIGKDVQIGAVLINPSGQQISFRYIRWWPSTVLEVRDQSGHLVPETEELRTLKNKWFYDGEWSGPPAIDKQWMTGPSPEDVAVLPPHVGPGQSGQVSWGVNVSKHYDTEPSREILDYRQSAQLLPKSQVVPVEQDLGDYLSQTTKRIVAVKQANSDAIPDVPLSRDYLTWRFIVS